MGDGDRQTFLGLEVEIRPLRKSGSPPSHREPSVDRLPKTQIRNMFTSVVQI